MKRFLICFLVAVLLTPAAVFSGEEGTRHITGDGVHMFFMNDKVFGTVQGHPLWALYNCGTDIHGEIDIDGEFYEFAFQYHRDGARMITGRFGNSEMGLGAVRRETDRLVYEVYFGETMLPFTIRYESIEGDHLVNSVIEGSLPGSRPIRLTTVGRLCPFATTGIILITAGAMEGGQ